MFNAGSSVTGLTLKALCAIGAVLFLIAAAIVLSLIPTYLPNHGSSLNYVQSQSQLFYIVYSVTLGNTTVNYAAFTSDVADATQQLNTQLGLSANTITVENIEIIQQSNSGQGRRKKRASNDEMLLTCRANYPRTYRSLARQQQFLTDISQRCSSHSNIVLKLRSALVTDQIIQFDLAYSDFTFTPPTEFIEANQVSSATTSQTLTNMQLVQNCIGQNVDKNPVIIDTDVDIDDMWAILYLLNIPTVEILAITTVGDGFSSPFYSAANVLSLLGLIGCTDRVAVASGRSVSSLQSGYVVSDSILNGIDTYITSSTCLNQSVNIFLQPSPFEAVELMIYTLKYSQRPVDILALGPFTNIAAAIIRDRSIVSKIGTVYVSGGQFKSLSSYPSLVPNPNLGIYPYTSKTSGSSSNIFLDVLAVQRVDDAGIKNLVAISSAVQKQLPTNLAQVNATLKQLNITLTPFIYAFITSLAKCTNQSESDIYWWDNSAAQLMIQVQNNLINGFCTTFQKVQALYITSADADQLFGQGVTNFGTTQPNTNGLSNYTICTQTNSTVFLTEFLTKLASNQLYGCQSSYANRFDIKLQSCLSMYGYD